MKRYSVQFLEKAHQDVVFSPTIISAWPPDPQSLRSETWIFLAIYVYVQYKLPWYKVNHIECVCWKHSCNIFFFWYWIKLLICSSKEKLLMVLQTSCFILVYISIYTYTFIYVCIYVVCGLSFIFTKYQIKLNEQRFACAVYFFYCDLCGLLFGLIANIARQSHALHEDCYCPTQPARMYGGGYTGGSSVLKGRGMEKAVALCLYELCRKKNKTKGLVWILQTCTFRGKLHSSLLLVRRSFVIIVWQNVCLCYSHFSNASP